MTVKGIIRMRKAVEGIMSFPPTLTKISRVVVILKTEYLICMFLWLNKVDFNFIGISLNLQSDYFLNIHFHIMQKIFRILYSFRWNNVLKNIWKLLKVFVYEKLASDVNISYIWKKSCYFTQNFLKHGKRNCFLYKWQIKENL